MFRNGIYKVGYRSPLHDEGSGENGFAIMRDGFIIGSDRLGAVFTGGPGLGGCECVTVKLTVPPGGELITGFRAGPAGATLKVLTQLDPEKLSQTAIVEVAGEPVEIQVSYLGPVPE